MANSWIYEDEWFEETNVARKIKEYLESEGYEVKSFNEDKHKSGDDILAEKDKQELVVEVKGYPSDKYVQGEKKGKRNQQTRNFKPSTILQMHYLSFCAQNAQIRIEGLHLGSQNLRFIKN